MNKGLKLLLLLIAFTSMFVPVAYGQKDQLILTDKDRKAIVELALNQGLKDFSGRFAKPSILDNCQQLILRDKKVLFLSTKNINPKFVPQITGIHFEVMTPDEIKTELETNRRHCYLVFERFEVVGSKVEVTLDNKLNHWTCPTCGLYIYAQGIVYEFSKIDGKWHCKYIRQFKLES